MRFSWLLAAVSWLVSTTLTADNLLQLPGGEAAVYEGTVKIAQAVDDTAPNEGNFTALLMVIARDTTAGKTELTVVRRLKPGDEDSRNIFSFDEVALKSSAEGIAVDTTGEAAPELEESSRELGFFLPLNLYPQSVSEASAENTGNLKVIILGSVGVDAPVVTKRVKNGETIEISNQLKEGTAPEFKFQEETSKLTAWSQKFAFDNARTLPNRIETSFAIEGKLGDSRATFRHHLVLTRKSQTLTKSEAGAGVALVVKSLQALNEDFASFKGVEEIALKVNALAETVKNTPLEALAELLKARLSSYKSSGFGALAADFTLESLDGKQVSFREATRGKVVLLSFWGVG